MSAMIRPPSRSAGRLFYTFLAALTTVGILGSLVIREDLENQGSHLLNLIKNAQYPLVKQRPNLEYRDDGYAVVMDDGGKRALSRHPIDELIERGKQRHAEMEAKKANMRTLEDAVGDYIEAFGMDPPEGFDAWYDLAISLNSTAAPSLLPMAHTAVLPYLAMPAPLLRARAREARRADMVYGIELVPEKKTAKNIDTTIWTVNRFPHWDWLNLVKEDVAKLPPAQQPDRPVQLSIWTDDMAFRLTDGPIFETSRELARSGQTWTVEELEAAETAASEGRGWGATCAPHVTHDDVLDSRLAADAASLVEKAFIYDLIPSMDFCRHPELIATNGEMIMKDDMAVHRMQPVMAISRPLHGADLLGPPTMGSFDSDLAPDMAWSDKNDSRAVFRGTATGLYHMDKWDWRSNQRDRLSTYFNNERNASYDLLVESERGVQRERVDLFQASKHYVDAGLIKEDLVILCGQGDATRFACALDDGPKAPNCPGSPTACEELKEETAWLPRLTKEETYRYKYTTDIDGHGWSSRFRRLLSSNTVVLKATVYPEWWTEQAIPWYHFVPTRYDFQDTLDILTFFQGTADGEAIARDDLAEEIAANGRRFALEQLRWEDMRSYMFLTLLEYRRAWSDDRQAASFSFDLD